MTLIQASRRYGQMPKVDVRSIHEVQIDLPEEITDDEVEFRPREAVNSVHQNEGLQRAVNDVLDTKAHPRTLRERDDVVGQLAQVLP